MCACSCQGLEAAIKIRPGTVVPVVLAVLALGAVPAGASAADTDPTQALASVQVTGQVVKVLPETATPDEGAEQTLLRLPGGALTPVDGLDDVPTGTTVSVQADVPAALEDDVQDDAGRRALDDARLSPASATTSVTTASTDAAASGDVPLQATSVRTLAAAETSGAAAAQTVTIAVVGVDGYTSSAYTPSVVTGMVQDASDYWSEQSQGRITFTQSGTTKTYTSSYPCSNATALWNEAAQKTGFTDGANKHLVVLLPDAAYEAGGCGYGLGTVGSSVADGGWVYVADTDWPALAHELGHNMSLEHANELTCGTTASDVAFSSSGTPGSGCTVNEYADGFDVMGVSTGPDANGVRRTGNLSTLSLRRLALVSSSQQQAVTATGVTTVTVVPSGTTTGVRTVAVTDPRNGNVYYLENRQPVGRDTYGWRGLGPTLTSGGMKTGYGLRVLKYGEDQATVLLDASPTNRTASASDPDTVVRPGTPFTDASGGIQISTTQNNDGTVAARISLAATGQSHTTTPADPGPGSGSTTDPTPSTGAAETVTTLFAPTTTTVGRTVTFSGAVDAVSSDDTAPTGTVSLLIGSQTVSLELEDDGTFAVQLTPKSAGKYTIGATYDGDDAFTTSSSDAVVIDVAKASSVTKVALATSTIRRTQSTTVKVAVSGPVAAGGTVTLVSTVDRTLAKAKLSSKGTATLTVKKGLKPGRRTLKVVYAGSSSLKGSTSKAMPLRVTR